MRVKGAKDVAAVKFNSNTAVYVGTEPAVSSAVSVDLRDDESVVEFSTVLHDASAARDHEIQLELAEGERIIDDGNNRAHVEDAAGNVTALIDAPWAKDAAGNDVPFTMSAHEAVCLAVAIAADAKADECVSKNQCLLLRYTVTGALAGVYCDGSRYCHDR